MYDLLGNRKSDITLLEETHSTQESSRKWNEERTGKSIWRSGPIPKSSGVAIIIKEKSNIEIISTQKDTEGRIIKCIINVEQELFPIINIYAPTTPSDRKISYKNLQKFIDYDNNTILAGDFKNTYNWFRKSRTN